MRSILELFGDLLKLTDLSMIINSLVLDINQKQMLIEQAKQAMDFAYSPYSGNKVGVALLSRKESVHLGANIGNSCSALNICAEQVAIGSAVMQSDLDLVAIAIVQSSGEDCVPCGRCLQLLSEFANNMIVLTSNGSEIMQYFLSSLLPRPFRRAERIKSS